MTFLTVFPKHNKSEYNEGMMRTGYLINNSKPVPSFNYMRTSRILNRSKKQLEIIPCQCGIRLRDAMTCGFSRYVVYSMNDLYSDRGNIASPHPLTRLGVSNGK